MTPSPFMVAREIGNNLSRSFGKARDDNAIERILSEAMSSGDPGQLQSSIGKILSQVSPERQGLAVQYLQNAYNSVQQKHELAKKRQAVEKEGLNPDLPESLQKTQFENKFADDRAKNIMGGGVVPTEPQGNVDLKNATDEQLIAISGVKGWSEPSKQELKSRQEDRTLKQKKEQAVRDEELLFHKESQAYDDDLLKQTKVAKNQVETIENIEKALSSGNVSPRSLANVFKGFGKIGDKISEALVNKDEAALQASIPQLLEGWKDVFGVRLTDADLKLLQDKLPSIGKSVDSNRAITKILRKYADMTLLRGQIAKEIKQKHKNLRPLGYSQMIEDRFDEMVMPVKVINPNNGRIIEIPAYKLSEAIKGGAKLANE